MEDDTQEYLEAAQKCVWSAATLLQEQNYDVAAVMCAITSAKMQMQILKLLNEINNNLAAIKEK